MNLKIKNYESILFKSLLVNKDYNSLNEIGKKGKSLEKFNTVKEANQAASTQIEQCVEPYTRNIREKSIGKTQETRNFTSKGSQEKLAKPQVTRTPIKTPRDKLLKAYIQSKPIPKPTARCASTKSMKSNRREIPSAVTPRSDSMYFD